MMPERAFPVVYSADVERAVAFYAELGFEERFRLPPEGEPGFVTLGRGAYELGVVTEQSPRELIGVEPGDAPRFELFVYVDDVDATVKRLAAPVLRQAQDMPWGERVAYVADPDGNPVALAAPAG